MAWGDLIHGLLEHAMRHPEYDQPAIEHLAKWLAYDNPDLMEAVPLAVETIERVKTSDFWREALAADERLVEVPFCVTLGDENMPPAPPHRRDRSALSQFERLACGRLQNRSAADGNPL